MDKMTDNRKLPGLYADLKIRLIPKSSRDEVLGKEGDTYRIKITAPPVDGKANQSLISFLSKKLKKPKRDMEILRGEKSRNKIVRVHGLSLKELDDLLGIT